VLEIHGHPHGNQVGQGFCLPEVAEVAGRDVTVTREDKVELDSGQFELPPDSGTPCVAGDLVGDTRGCATLPCHGTCR
jgi:hypothetical protein